MGKQPDPQEGEDGDDSVQPDNPLVHECVHGAIQGGVPDGLLPKHWRIQFKNYGHRSGQGQVFCCLQIPLSRLDGGGTNRVLASVSNFCDHWTKRCTIQETDVKSEGSFTKSLRAMDHSKKQFGAKKKKKKKKIGGKKKKKKKKKS